MKISAINIHRPPIITPRPNFSNNINFKGNLIDNIKSGMEKISCPYSAKPVYNKNLSEEEKTNQEINEFIHRGYVEYKSTSKIAKPIIKDCNNAIITGFNSNYKGKIPYYSSIGKVNLTFSKVNPEFNMPDVINGWSKGKCSFSFQIYNVKAPSYFTFRTFDGPISKTYHICGDKLNCVEKQNIRNQEITQFIPTKEGFFYAEGIVENDDIKTSKEVNINLKNPKENSYIVKNGNIGLIHKYDKKQKKWVQIGYSVEDKEN